MAKKKRFTLYKVFLNRNTLRSVVSRKQKLEDCDVVFSSMSKAECDKAQNLMMANINRAMVLYKQIIGKVFITSMVISNAHFFFSGDYGLLKLLASILISTFVCYVTFFATHWLLKDRLNSENTLITLEALERLREEYLTVYESDDSEYYAPIVNGVYPFAILAIIIINVAVSFGFIP